MFEIGDEEITRPDSRPLCVAIGCLEDEAMRWSICANGAGFLLRAVSLEAARIIVRAWRPMAVVISTDVYAFDPAGLLRMARDADATLIRVGRGRNDEAMLETELTKVLCERRAVINPEHHQSGVRRRVFPTTKNRILSRTG